MTALSDTAIAEMREAAERATPGPWFTTGLPWFRSEDGVLAGSPDGNVGFLIADCENFACPRDEYEGSIHLASADADAAHIAAWNPFAALAVLDELAAQKARADKAEAALAEMREALEPFGQNPNATSLAKCFGHLTREDAHRAARLAATSDPAPDGGRDAG